MGKQYRKEARKQNSYKKAKRLRATTLHIAKSDNFLVSNIEKNSHFERESKIISHFGGNNNMLVDCNSFIGV